MNEADSILAWANALLQKKQLEAKDVSSDFSDGVLLINLLQQAYHVPVTTAYNRQPKQHFQKLDNISIALDFLSNSTTVTLLSIDGHSLVNGQRKQTLSLLFNILRDLTLRSFQGKYTGPTVRSGIISWSNDILSTSGVDQVEDLWDGFKSGDVLLSIVATLTGEDVSVEGTPIEKCDAAFKIAQEKLGIPPPITAEALISGEEVQEKVIESYLCMLISAKDAMTNDVDDLETKIAEVTKVKDLEFERLQERMENEKTHNELLKSEIDDLKEFLAQIESSVAEVPQLSLLLTSNETQVVEDITQEEHLVEQQYESLISELRAKIVQLEEDNLKLNSEIYRSHKEHEGVLANFRMEMRAEVEANADMGTIKNLGVLLGKALIEDMGVDDFLDSRGVRSAWVNLEHEFPVKKKKRRSIASFMELTGSSNPTVLETKRRWVEIRGARLYWYHTKGGPVEGVVELKEYELIQMRQNSVVNHTFLLKQRVSGTVEDFDKAGEDPVIRLVPKPGSSAEELKLHNFVSVGAKYSFDTFAWIGDINDRISLETYLAKIREFKPTNENSKTCREILDFIASEDESALIIQDKVLRNLVHALEHFTESLIMRKDLSISFTNTALMDDAVNVLGNILKWNHTIRNVNLSRNLITAESGVTLRDSLIQNPGIQDIDLSCNCIGDKGLQIISEAIQEHPELSRVGLHRNKIGDSGVVAFVEALKYNANQGCLKIHMLELERNQIGDMGCEAIAELSMLSPLLECVYLSHNLITDAGVQHIAKAIETTGNGIRKLFLADNQISSRGAKILAEAAAKSPHPIMIDLSDNKLIGHAGYSEFFKVDETIHFDLFRAIVNYAKVTPELP